MSSGKIFLSVCMITYNHAKYIEQALNSILEQKVNFTWNITIADDCSTDGTKDILLKYQESYPGLIKLILRPANVGAISNWLNLMEEKPNCKYIAFCEGDDYWCDPHKLQKQVDFLEEHPEIVCHTHNAEVVDGNGFVRLYNDVVEPQILYADDLVASLSIPTASIVYRNCLNPMPDYVVKLPYDIVTYYAMAQHGAFYQSPDVMSAYRYHEEGMWSGQAEIKKLNANIAIKEHFLYQLPLTPKQKKLVRQMLLQVKLNRLKYYANNHLFSRNYFKDFLDLLKGRVAGYKFSTKFLVMCLVPDAIINTLKK